MILSIDVLTECERDRYMSDRKKGYMYVYIYIQRYGWRKSSSTVLLIAFFSSYSSLIFAVVVAQNDDKSVEVPITVVVCSTGDTV